MDKIKKKTAIFDIDGTLADCEHRRHFVTQDKKDWASFFAGMSEDPVNEVIRGLCNMYYMNGWTIIICTGRQHQHRQTTLDWLERKAVFYHKLMIRPEEKSHTPDYEVKQTMLDEIRIDHNVVVAVDDRNQVVEMWRRNGITCLQVADGDF